MTQGYTQNIQIPVPLSKGGTGQVLTSPVITQINTYSISAVGAFSYTPSIGTQRAIFKMVAAGGGGGGTTGAVGQSCHGGAGGGGASMEIQVDGTTNLANITGVIGDLGAAGASGNNAGGNGGNTSLTINGGTPWVTIGGAGGSPALASAVPQISGDPGTGGMTSTGTNATLIDSIAGTDGGYGASFGNVLYWAQAIGGGSSMSPTCSRSNTGGAAYGGGAPGVQNFSAGSLPGQPGAQGFIIVTEFISV